MKTISLVVAAALLLPSLARAEQNYCLAIRGNGENVAAHWPAMARIVEENGLPEAAAGGSSASVSLFFLDSLAGNAVMNDEKDPVKRRKMQALLLKSLPEFVTLMARQDRLTDAFTFLQELKNKDSALRERLLRYLAGKGEVDNAELRRVFAKYLPLVNPDMIKGLKQKPGFFRGEAMNALKVFGQFNAQSDANLFVRPGLVDFKYFSLILGSVADFYAGNADDSTNQSLNKFARTCAEDGYQKPWANLSGACRASFESAVVAYLQRGTFANRALFEQAGANLRSYPSTAVLKVGAVGRFRRLREAYFQGDTSADFAGFNVSVGGGELGFGYWGKDSELKAIGKKLADAARAGDEKAKHFTSLGGATWFEVLATSPAEPGLASVQEIPTNITREQVLAAVGGGAATRWDKLATRPALLSAGGWSDLHPTGVLKAAGCEHVVYLTRRDGDAIFGQQVFIRLAGLTKIIPFWDKIGDHNNDGWKVDGEVAYTPWNALYNLGNPESSFNRALRNADAVYCTDWNRYKVFGGEMGPMVTEAYTSPVFLKAGAPKSFQVNPERSGDFPGCRN